MVNEDKIKIMTKLASYEENEGKKDLEVIKRMKMDYISHNSFVTLFFVSLALLILFGADFAIKFFAEMSTFTDFDFVGAGVEYLTIWILVMVGYTFISGRIYRHEYDGAMKGITQYKENLKALDRFYKKN